jgi:hypothetical protein
MPAVLEATTPLPPRNPLPLLARPTEFLHMQGLHRILYHSLNPILLTIILGK